jgi:hypothetical protein
MLEDQIAAALWVRPSGPNSEPKAGDTPAGQRADRRSDHRARALLKGKIILAGGGMSADCVIRDLSSDGARVRVDSGVPLAGGLGLLVIRDGVMFDAVLAWRKGDQAGLAFSGRHDIRAAGDPELAHVHALWVELAPR